MDGGQDAGALLQDQSEEASRGSSDLTPPALWQILDTYRNEFLDHLNSRQDKEKLVEELKNIDPDFAGIYLSDDEDALIMAESTWNSTGENQKMQYVALWNKEF